MLNMCRKIWLYAIEDNWHNIDYMTRQHINRGVANELWDLEAAFLSLQNRTIDMHQQA